MDRATLAAYDTAAATYAEDWHAQPPPADLHDIVRRFFGKTGETADIGSGSGREVAWLNANGYSAIGYDASEALIAEAKRRYPACRFLHGELPALAGVPPERFDNVLCETVIMHLPCDEIAPAARRLMDVLKPGGTLYLSWRVTRDGDRRDERGRLYSAFDAALVRNALSGAAILHEEEAGSLSSGNLVHRVVVRKA